MEPKTSGQWYFLPLEGTEVAGRGWSQGKFSIYQVSTVDVRAMYEENGVPSHNSVLPSVPRFLVSAFAYLQEKGIGFPDSGDKDETFRKAGSTSRQNRFWEEKRFESSTDSESFRSLTHIDVGALIKRFLRDLKVPIIGSHSRLLVELLEEKAKTPRALEFDVTRYPLAGTLSFILCNLHLLSLRGSTRMTMDTLAIVFAPSLIRPENSKDKESLSSHQSAVLLMKYLITMAPMIMLRRDGLATRPTSVPPAARRTDGVRSRSVVKRIVGLVRAKSHEGDEPIVRGIMKSSLRRGSRLSIPPLDRLSESRRSRSTARRTPCWSPVMKGGGTPLCSFSSVFAADNRVASAQESMDKKDIIKKRLFSDDGCALAPSTRNSLALVTDVDVFDKQRRSSTAEHMLFSADVQAPSTVMGLHDGKEDYSTHSVVDVSNVTLVFDDHDETAGSACTSSMDQAFIEPQYESEESAGTNDDKDMKMKDVFKIPQMRPKKSVIQPEFHVNENFAAMMRSCSDSSELDSVVFRTEPSFMPSRPSLVQLRKNQTVQKKRAVFEKPPSVNDDFLHTSGGYIQFPSRPLASRNTPTFGEHPSNQARRSSVAAMTENGKNVNKTAFTTPRRYADQKRTF